MIFHITLFINGKEEGEYSYQALFKFLKEIQAEFPKANLDQPIENGTMSLEIEDYWEAQNIA